MKQILGAITLFVLIGITAVALTRLEGSSENTWATQKPAGALYATTKR